LLINIHNRKEAGGLARSQKIEMWAEEGCGVASDRE